MSFFSHDKAIVESSKIGDGTRIWAFAHILSEAIIGMDCNICDNVFIENDVIIGNRVTIKCGVQLWDGIVVEDDVFIGPNATFTNDPFPRSKCYPEKYAKTVVRKGASIGANATILPGLMIGRDCMVGAGAVVTRDVPPNAIVVGNPARIVGYTNTNEIRSTEPVRAAEIPPEYPINIGGSKVFELPVYRDLRGSISVSEHPATLPFKPERCFFVFDVPGKDVRGEHAHRKLHEVLICIHGSVAVVLDDGNNRMEIILDTPCRSLYIPPMVWTIQYKYSPGAILAVLASDLYDSDDYIRNYDDFLSIVR